MRVHKTLHPLQAVVNPAYPGDTSVDTARTVVSDEANQNFEAKEVLKIFGEPGIDTQGPSGSKIPENAGSMHVKSFEVEDEVPYGYSNSVDAPEDAVGPVPKIGNPGSFTIDEMNHPEVMAAVEAADLLQKKLKENSGDDTGFLVAMEQAENDQLKDLDKSGENRDNKKTIRESLRIKVAERLTLALSSNPNFVGDAEGTAIECEQVMYQGARSATVYQSVSANAIRVAHTVAGLQELLRVARGEPSEAEGRRVSQPHFRTSLIGNALEPSLTSENAEAFDNTVLEAVVKIDYTQNM